MPFGSGGGSVAAPLTLTQPAGGTSPTLTLQGVAGQTVDYLKVLSALGTALLEYQVNPPQFLLSGESGHALTETLISGVDFSGTSGFTFRANGEMSLFGAEGDPTFKVFTDGHATLQPDTTLAAADPILTLLDETGAKVFEVRNDGSLHGKTGKALTFDL